MFNTNTDRIGDTNLKINGYMWRYGSNSRNNIQRRF